MVIEVCAASQPFRQRYDPLTHSCVLGTPRFLRGMALQAVVSWAHNTVKRFVWIESTARPFGWRMSEAPILS